MIPKCKNSSVQSIRRQVDWAWLAGIIDGEGNLNVQVRPGPNGKPYFRPKVRVANTDIRMIQKISEIYAEAGVVFFYSVHPQRGKNGAAYKTQMNIEVASQGSGAAVLEWIMPYLINKRRTAEALLALIRFVQRMPKGGNTLAVDYVSNPTFVALRAEFDKQARWYVDASTTSRRAGTPLVLPMIKSGLVGDNERPAEMTGLAA